MRFRNSRRSRSGAERAVAGPTAAAALALALAVSLTGCQDGATGSSSPSAPSVATHTGSGSGELVPCGPADDQHLVTDAAGNVIPNSDPSTPECEFNLMEDVGNGTIVSERPVDRASPFTDLEVNLEAIVDRAEDGTVARDRIQRVIDILEGNPVEGKPYSGIPLLIHHAWEETKTVPAGGNVHVTQIWFGQKILSDTYFLKFEDMNEPFTVTWHVRVLEGGADDWTPVTMVGEPNSGMPPTPIAGFDSSFFPTDVGTEYTFRVHYPPPKYVPGFYTWGWRIHPPRVQFTARWNPVFDSKTKPVGIEDLASESPTKKVWSLMQQARASDDAGQVASLAEEALEKWYPSMVERRDLPPGFEPDPDADFTLVYANNQIYGSGIRDFRSTGSATVHLVNADDFDHKYLMLKFFDRQEEFSSQDFGSFDWKPLGSTVIPANSEKTIQIDLGTEQGFLLYQFDPWHHDQAIYSLHTE